MICFKGSSGKFVELASLVVVVFNFKASVNFYQYCPHFLTDWPEIRYRTSACNGVVQCVFGTDWWLEMKCLPIFSAFHELDNLWYSICPQKFGTVYVHNNSVQYRPMSTTVRYSTCPQQFGTVYVNNNSAHYKSTTFRYSVCPQHYCTEYAHNSSVQHMSTTAQHTICSQQLGTVYVHNNSEQCMF